MPQPEGQSKHNDLIDAVITSSQKTITVEQKDGIFTKEQVLDEDTIWTKLLSVASNTLGQCIFSLKEWERSAFSANRNMCAERAEDIQHDIMEIGQSVRRAIDSKSSESIGINKQSQQTTLLGMIGKNKQERVITLNEKARKTLFDSIMGREGERTVDDES